jgi:hypothetical protein
MQPGWVKMERTMQKKSFFAYAIAVAGIVILTAAAATPALSREAQKAANYQLQSATSSFAYAPQQVITSTRNGQCWIATDSSRGYGYRDSCANPLSRDPSLDPTYNPEW